MNVDDIYQDILLLPEPVQDQVRDFVEYLKKKYVQEETHEVFFWALIEKVNLDKGIIPEALDELVAHLSTLSIDEIYTYQDILASKLSQLDGPDFWEIGGGSADGFLYKRCYVVAQGKDFFQKVLADATAFPAEPWLELEWLLYTPTQAYERKTGEELERLPATNYETRFNAKNWGEEAIQL